MNLDKDIIKVLWNSIIIYRQRCLNHPELSEQIKKDKECKGDDDYEYFIMLYLIQAFTREEKGVSIIYNKLVNAGIDKKKANNFIYSFLKMNLKCDKGLWSWCEIDEYNIDPDKIKKTTTKYKFF
tara:strand:+ start:148 stop:522 length:375 start_codon:yes stop_codon:yes gene_type:complete